MGVPPPVDTRRNKRCGEISLLAASALCPFGVARVSRLIGKSDTTAKRAGWQVHKRGTGKRGIGSRAIRVSSQQQAPIHETPLQTEWRFAVLRWSLASQAIEDGGYIHRAFCRLSGRFPLLRGRYFGGWLLPGPAVLWAGRNFLQQPVHHWHPTYSNCRTKHVSF
jgi:hypothetical protein